MARCDSPEGGRWDGRQPTEESPCQSSEDAKPGILLPIPEICPSGEDPPEGTPKINGGRRPPEIQPSREHRQKRCVAVWLWTTGHAVDNPAPAGCARARIVGGLP